MDFFKRAKVFRLKCGHRNKYLSADKDDETIRQSSDSSSTNTHWVIEFVEGKTNVVRFRSRKTFKYLATTEETFLTGMTGKRLAQRLRLDSTVEWEPVKEGQYLKLKSQSGTLLRANPWVPPWSNSVTHDVPGHWSGSESMILWIVDIVELDYGSNRGSKGGNESPSAYVGTPPEVVKHTIDVPASSSSNVGNWNSQSPRNSTDGDGSFRHKKSNSKSKLKPVESVLDQELSNSGKLSRLPSAESMTGLAINVAKITFNELKNTEFHVVLSSGQIKKLEKAVSVVSANAKISSRGNKDLANLEQRLKDLTKDHKRASEELVEYTTFSSRRYEIRAELKQDVAKARELKALKTELNNTLMEAKARREELLKQLQETENEIMVSEKGQADSKVEIEELISRINVKREEYIVTEKEHRSWKTRKYEAQRMLERVEEDWLEVKSIISDFC